MISTPWVSAGLPVSAVTPVLILLHGRGASAQDILGLADHLPVAGYSLLAPQAPTRTWYPHSFLAPVEQNEPQLTHSLGLVDQAVQHAIDEGVEVSDIYLLGFSQGACLALEYAARHARRYGGVTAFTGGLIGASLDPDRYPGDLAGTPVFLGSGDPDPHVPALRVRETAELLNTMHASVLTKIFPGMPHTVTGEELALAASHVFGAVAG